jgi:hypothetical protein
LDLTDLVHSTVTTIFLKIDTWNECGEFSYTIKIPTVAPSSIWGRAGMLALTASDNVQVVADWRVSCVEVAASLTGQFFEFGKLRVYVYQLQSTSVSARSESLDVAAPK